MPKGKGTYGKQVGRPPKKESPEPSGYNRGTWYGGPRMPNEFDATADDYADGGKVEGNIPTYDAGGRVQNIQGYGDGGKISKEEDTTTYYKSDGKWEKQHHFSKQQELSRERDIKKTARSIVGKPPKATKNITDVVKMVEAKEREAKRTHKHMKEIDKRDKK